MTDTTIDTAEQAAGALAHLDPQTLDIGDNVREFANLTKPLLDSIREHGVLVPLTAVRLHDGAVQVRNGQRRTMAARELGLSTVPVYVLDSSDADADAETIDRIVHQIVTNDQKRDLSDAQRARGIQQMIDAGLSVTKVAKLSVAKDTVQAAAVAAKSGAALEALETGQISLTEAAVLTEFDQDGPEVVARLVRAAGAPRSSTTSSPSCTANGPAPRPWPKRRPATSSVDSPSSATRTAGDGARTGCRCGTCSASERTANPRT
jgi:ParB family chromosome partitioning protein